MWLQGPGLGRRPKDDGGARCERKKGPTEQRSAWGRRSPWASTTRVLRHDVRDYEKGKALFTLLSDNRIDQARERRTPHMLISVIKDYGFDVVGQAVREGEKSGPLTASTSAERRPRYKVIPHRRSIPLFPIERSKSAQQPQHQRRVSQNGGFAGRAKRRWGKPFGCHSKVVRSDGLLRCMANRKHIHHVGTNRKQRSVSRSPTKPVVELAKIKGKQVVFRCKGKPFWVFSQRQDCYGEPFIPSLRLIHGSVFCPPAARCFELTLGMVANDDWTRHAFFDAKPNFFRIAASTSSNGR